MQSFNYTVLLSQAQENAMLKGLAHDVLRQARTWPRFTAVGRKPYSRRKYKYTAAAEADRLVNREVL